MHKVNKRPSRKIGREKRPGNDNVLVPPITVLSDLDHESAIKEREQPQAVEETNTWDSTTTEERGSHVIDQSDSTQVTKP